MKNTLSWALAAFMLYILLKFGLPQYTHWDANHTLEMGLVEQKLAQNRAEKESAPDTILVGHQWTKDLYRDLKNGESLQITPVGSPGVWMEALVNETEVREWTSDTPTNHWGGATLRIRVSPIHHPILKDLPKFRIRKI